MTAPTPTPVPSRVSSEVKFAERITGLAMRVIAGGLGIAGGAWLFEYGLTREKHQFMMWGAGLAVGAALVLPSIFDAIKPVILFFFPNGIPFLGRLGNGPKPPQA